MGCLAFLALYFLTMSLLAYLSRWIPGYLLHILYPAVSIAFFWGFRDILAHIMLNEGIYARRSRERVATALRNGFTRFKDSEHLRREEKLEEMDDEELERRVKRHPKDILARWKWSERLKENGDLPGYGREREELLLMNSGLDIAEKNSLFHQLADFYLNELRQPNLACRALERFVTVYPRAPEAIRTRERIRRIRAMLPLDSEGQAGKDHLPC